MSNKKYGLILAGAKVAPLTFQASRNVFGEDSDSDGENPKKPVLLRPSDITARQTKVSQEKALKEDPTVYQYDEIYDSMTSKKEKKVVKSKEEKKPKYIENLLKTANKRKIENERRIERQIQKERETEGDEFADKEVFVTSAYKKKLEEMAQEEEKEKREEYLEGIGDVTKQQDLGGFYRHLYEQKLGSDKLEDQEKTPDKKASSDNKDEKKNSKINHELVLETKKRNYRKRKASSEVKKHMSDGEIDDSDDEINRINLEEIRQVKKFRLEDNIDADSDFSVDDPSEDEETSKKAVDVPTKMSKAKLTEPEKDLEPQSSEQKNDISKSKNNEKENIKPVVVVESKPKIDIWKKRTVGEVFEQSLKRYYERKAARGS